LTIIFNFTIFTFIFEGEDNGRRIRVNVGTGFSDADRELLWRIRDECLGQIGEIEADAVTQNQDGTYSLRFPRFKTWRGFGPGEKL
jgi:DNA ligase-1